MRIGTMFLGKVDSIGSESIQTKFFILGMPLFPISSHYVLEEQVNGISGFEIPTHGKSVIFGYVRMYAWIGALLCGVFAYIGRRSAGGMWAWCVILAAVAAATTFALGGLSRREKLRRTVLRLTTGVGAPPDLLPADRRSAIAEKLSQAWDEANEGKPWRAAVEGGATDPALFALAEYHREPLLAEAILERMMAGKKTTSGQAYR
jgi:hypothetical protein